MFAIRNLPRKINIEGNRYSVRTDFRTWINAETILTDDNIPSNFKLFVLANNLNLFYGNEEIFNESMDAVINGILSFWRMFKESDNNAASNTSSDIAYDYEQDFDLICAAFKQQYNINLRREQMHWFEYKALFDGLTKETQFVKIVGYRTADINRIPKEQRKEYRRLKEMYAIKKNKVHRRSQKEIEAELLSK